MTEADLKQIEAEHLFVEPFIWMEPSETKTIRALIAEVRRLRAEAESVDHSVIVGEDGCEQEML